MSNSVEVIANRPGLVLAVRMGNVLTVHTSVCIRYNEEQFAPVREVLHSGNWIIQSAVLIRDKGMMFSQGWTTVYHTRGAFIE